MVTAFCVCVDQSNSRCLRCAPPCFSPIFQLNAVVFTWVSKEIKKSYPNLTMTHASHQYIRQIYFYDTYYIHTVDIRAFTRKIISWSGFNVLFLASYKDNQHNRKFIVTYKSRTIFGLLWWFTFMVIRSVNRWFSVVDESAHENWQKILVSLFNCLPPQSDIFSVYREHCRGYEFCFVLKTSSEWH